MEVPLSGTVFTTAVFFGLVSALALPLGAIIGVTWRPPDRVLAFLLAFGGGALLAALTLDLVAPGVDRGHFFDLAIGAIIGGFLYKGLDHLVNRRGGYLRKPSTAMSYWRNQARDRLDRVLSSLNRVRPLGGLPYDSKEALLKIMQVKDVPAGTAIYRLGDPPDYLYIVESGAVELTDPARHGEVFEKLGPFDAFGRISFLTGLPRATEAYAASDCTLLLLPRDQLMELLPEDDALREAVGRALEVGEVVSYLERRQGLTAEEASTWRTHAVASLLESGSYESPYTTMVLTEDSLVDLLRHDPRLPFFADLSEEALRAVVGRLIHRAQTKGHDIFHAGQPSDRVFFLRRGRVHLVDADPRHPPEVVRSGSSFGGMSFLTGGVYTRTAVAMKEAHVSILRRDDFDSLVTEIPELRARLGEFLRTRHVDDYLVGRHELDPKRAARWVEKAAKSVEGGRIFPSLAEMTQTVASHSGAAMAIWLGILLDGIPESFVIGANVLVSGGVTLSLIVGLFLANFPEALSSAAGMREQGMRRTRILVMWTSLTIITGAGAGIGTLFLREAPEEWFALIEGLAAGAMLTMIAETMLPEAFHKGGGIVGLSTLGGFLAAISANSLHW
jgi:CRP-like cAMP-binding protein